jgi:FAD/FMN-containing dehydrogenase
LPRSNSAGDAAQFVVGWVPRTFRLVADFGGNINVERGIGTAEKRRLPLSRTMSEIAAFRSLKRAFDPDGIRNPTVLLPSVEG